MKHHYPISFAFLLVLLPALHSLAGPGDLDPSFNGTGIVITNVAGNSNADRTKDAVVLSNGKILAVGEAQISGNSTPSIALLRYNSDGTLDTSFNGTGKVFTTDGAGILGNAIALQSDGKIIVAGSRGAAAVLVRYQADGTVDTDFNGTGIVTTSIGTGVNSWTSVAIAPDGSIYTAGYATNGTNEDFAVGKFTAAGVLDPSFDSDGLATTSFGTGSGEIAYDIAIQTDGKIVVGGDTGFTTDQFGVVRYRTDGSLDTDFDGDGKKSFRISTAAGNIGVGFAMVLQPDQKILMAGVDHIGVNNFGVVRLLSDGSFDPAFGTGGKVITDMGTTDDAARSMALQADGKIIVLGDVEDLANGSPLYGDFALARYNPDGSLDTSFNGTGKVVKNVSVNDVPEEVVLQPNGDILAVGTSSAQNNPNFTLLRFFAEGPEIVVEQPAATNLVDGTASAEFGVLLEGTSTSLTFTIKNVGTQDLNGLGITFDGAHAAYFSVTAAPVAPVAGPSGSTTFTVQFAPLAAGVKTAALHITHNDPNENTFDINLTGESLALTGDYDGDGVSNGGEANLAALGFDHLVNNAPLVTLLRDNGLYRAVDVQALHVGTPLIQKNPTTGTLTLTVGVEKSTDLVNFTPFPFISPQTTINGQGEIEFQFAVPDNAAFFQLRAE